MKEKYIVPVLTVLTVLPDDICTASGFEYFEEGNGDFIAF